MSTSGQVEHLNAEQANALLGQHNCPSLEEFRTISYKDYHCFSIGEQSPRLPDFIKCVVKAVHTSPVLFLALEWGIWPSSEVPGLFDETRGFEADAASQVEFPGELVPTSKTRYLVRLSTIAAKFGWNFALVELEKRGLFYFSHDSWFAFEFSGEDSWKRFLPVLERFQPREFLGCFEVDVDPAVLTSEEGRALQTDVSRILWEEWDPLSMKMWDDAPVDEYDMYVLTLIGIMQKGGDADAITEYLGDVERDRMDRVPEAEKNAKVTNLCLVAYKKRYP